MNDLIGNKSLVAFNVQGCAEGYNNSQIIDLWVDGRLITKVDNIAYLPSFFTHLDRELDKLKCDLYESEDLAGLDESEVFKRLAYGGFQVLSYDVSINSALMYFYTVAGAGKLFYSFFDRGDGMEEDAGVVRSMPIDKDYLIGVLEELKSRLLDDHPMYRNLP